MDLKQNSNASQENSNAKSINIEGIENFAKSTMSQYDNLKVVIRVRPPLPREMEPNVPFRSSVLVSKDNKGCSIVEYLGSEISEGERQREWVENPNMFQTHHFTFDYTYDMDSSQADVYENTAKSAVLSVLEGYNSTIFAYGQTGTGKTFTMEGFTYDNNDPARGIIPRSIEEIFNFIESYSNTGTKFMVRASYLQIYNENISDLLKPERYNLKFREDKKKGVFVDGLTEWAVRSPSDIYSLLQRGASSRTTASTKMNDVSSRSHAVFLITVEQMTNVIIEGEAPQTKIKVGKLNLVDLAGSERIKITGATGKQLEESKKINKSLSSLGNVIYALTDVKGRNHIPYRDSKLTRLLEDSLGGNCKTTMMAMISPSQDSFAESLSTLHFAKRAKNIKNKPKINEDIDHKTLIRQYENELKRLRSELDEKTKEIHSNEIIMQLQEQKKRAEEDKQVAMIALEQASRKYILEREEKKKLESKIEMMNSQMIIGGSHKMEDTPQFRSALEKRQLMLMKEFDQKLKNFEFESERIDHDKAQAEKYMSLLLKQKDIMVALTTKLNERDESLVQLQDQIDVYVKSFKEQEEIIKNLKDNTRIYENMLRANNISIPESVLDINEKINNVMTEHSKLVNDLGCFKSPNPSRGLSKLNNSQNNNQEKSYVPYHVEKNEEEFQNSLITLLSADEKIIELRRIIEEQEREYEVLVKILQNNIKDNENKENYYPSDEKYNFLVNQNKMLSEHNIILSNKCEELLQEKSSFTNKLKSDLKSSFENIYNNLAAENTEKNYYLSQEILYLYKTITEFYEENSSAKEAENTKNTVDLNSLNNSVNRNDKKFSSLSQYNNNYNLRRYSNPSVYQNKFPVNSIDSSSIINESNQGSKQNTKNYLSSNNSITNLKQKTPVRRPEYLDDSIRKVEDSNNLIKDSNENKTLSLNQQQSSKMNFSQNSKTNINKLDNYINKFLNK